jgi:hypothetical protein
LSGFSAAQFDPLNAEARGSPEGMRVLAWIPQDSYNIPAQALLLKCHDGSMKHLPISFTRALRKKRRQANEACPYELYKFECWMNLAGDALDPASRFARPKKRGVPGLHGGYAARELLFPKSSLLLYNSLWELVN